MEVAREEDTLPQSLFEGYPEDVDDYLHWYMDAFFRLSKSRATTMAGIWFIPVSEILAFAHHLEMDTEQTERFIDYIQVLDEEYVNVVNSDSKDSRRDSESQKKTLN